MPGKASGRVASELASYSHDSILPSSLKVRDMDSDKASAEASQAQPGTGKDLFRARSNMTR